MFGTISVEEWVKPLGLFLSTVAAARAGFHAADWEGNEGVAQPQGREEGGSGASSKKRD